MGFQLLKLKDFTVAKFNVQFHDPHLNVNVNIPMSVNVPITVLNVTVPTIISIGSIYLFSAKRDMTTLETFLYSAGTVLLSFGSYNLVNYFTEPYRPAIVIADITVTQTEKKVGANEKCKVLSNLDVSIFDSQVLTGFQLRKDDNSKEFWYEVRGGHLVAYNNGYWGFFQYRIFSKIPVINKLFNFSGTVLRLANRRCFYTTPTPGGKEGPCFLERHSVQVPENENQALTGFELFYSNNSKDEIRYRYCFDLIEYNGKTIFYDDKDIQVTETEYTDGANQTIGYLSEQNVTTSEPNKNFIVGFNLQRWHGTDKIKYKIWYVSTKSLYGF